MTALLSLGGAQPCALQCRDGNTLAFERQEPQEVCHKSWSMYSTLLTLVFQSLSHPNKSLLQGTTLLLLQALSLGTAPHGLFANWQQDWGRSQWGEKSQLWPAHVQKCLSPIALCHLPWAPSSALEGCSVPSGRDGMVFLPPPRTAMVLGTHHLGWEPCFLDFQLVPKAVPLPNQPICTLLPRAGSCFTPVLPSKPRRECWWQLHRDTAGSPH